MSGPHKPAGRYVDFVDTSILTNILQVPHKCRRYQEIREGSETGNHIFQLKDGDARRRCAQKYAAVLRMTADGQTPWTVGGLVWAEIPTQRSGAGACVRTTRG